MRPKEEEMKRSEAAGSDSAAQAGGAMTHWHSGPAAFPSNHLKNEQISTVPL